MRSNKKSATRFLLHRNLFIGVIVFLAAFYMMPFWALSHMPNEKATLAAMDLAAPEVITERLTRSVSEEVMTRPLNLELMVILYGGLGFLTALMLMRHQFSRRQSMLYAALPDKRETDFLRRCAGYAALCLVPILFNFILYLLVVALGGLLGYVEWSVLLPRFGMLLVINFYGFAMGVLASVLTGTYWAALLAGGVLIVGAEALAALWYWLGGRYLHTLVKDSFTDALLRFSPAYSLYKTFYKPAEFACWPGVAAIVLALALSFALYRIRKTERAEHTLAFAPLHGILSFVLPLLGGTFMGIVIKMSFQSEISLIAGMVLGVILTFWVCRIVFNQRFCGILKQWYLPAASAAVLVLGVVVLHHDLLGFDRFLPDREKLTSIAYHPRSYDSSEIITLTSDDALDAAYAWCELMRGEVDSYENGLIAESAFSGSDVVITYQMGNRKVHRHYPNGVIRNEAQDSIRCIVESDDYRKSIISEYHLNSGFVTRMYVNTQSPMMENDIFYERFGNANRSYERDKDGEKLDELLSALAKDILNRTLDERQKDAILNVGLTIETPGSRDTRYKQLSIYPGDTNVLNILFGSKAEEVTQYMTGGYADSEDILVLKIDFAYTRKEMSKQKSLSLRDAIESVTLAASAEQAKEWIAHAWNTSAKNYYYKPYVEEDPYQRLYIYRMSTVEKYSGSYGYEVPEDKTKLYEESMIPVEMVLDYVGAN